MKPKFIILIGTALLLTVAIAVGFSYALWSIRETQSGENLVDSGCFSIVFAEDSSSTINLTNSFPLTDDQGMFQAPYFFSIENTCTVDARYSVNLEVLSITDISHDLIKYSIDGLTPSIISNTTTATIEGATAYNLSSYNLAPGAVNEHMFRMWIDGSGTLSNAANKKIQAKITVSAEAAFPPYTDPVLAGSDPVLDSKMIPVNIADTGVVTVADIYEDAWYSYAESKWANAVIVDPTFTTLNPGTTIPMESIEQMYVWIPRYEYKKSSIVNAQESIEINFVPISKVNTDIENNDVIIHPAFTFGGVEQAGLWVGKFELGWQNIFIDAGDYPKNNNDMETTYIIKPNVNSAHNANVSTMFYNIQRTKNAYSLDATTDMHMMKNTEWGAVAYLSQSKYGICEDDVACSVKIENNNYYSSSNGYDIVTGCGGSDTSQDVSELGINICPASNRWETANGIKASTTHNITGIYDMAGGRWEYVMGNMQDSSGNFYPSLSGFTTTPDAKHYDSYANGSSSSDYTRGIYGDATVELNPYSTTMSNWSSDKANFVNSTYSWFNRGGSCYDDSGAGVWNFSSLTGYPNGLSSARSVLSFAQ